jgi:16S rRNA (guanine1207-N2)-methyltransferase
VAPSPDDTAQYFSERPAAPSSRRTIRVRLPDVRLDLTTDRGVFAGHRLDQGTDTLLRRGELQVPDGDVLDLGCGYGPIALSLARRNRAATVWATDVNERARALCVENAETSGLANVRVAAPDDIPEEVSFAALWSNPPIRIGKVALHALLERWMGRLAPSGSAHLVVHKNLGSDSLARWMSEQGWGVVRRTSHDGYRLLDVVPPGPPEVAPPS